MSDLEDYDPFVYRARCESIVDGDTMWFTLDLGLDIHTFEKIRLLNADTRETHFVSHDSEEYRRGKIHTEFVEDWIEAATLSWTEDQWPFFVDTEYDATGDHERLLADVYAREDPTKSLEEALFEEFDDVEEVDY